MTALELLAERDAVHSEGDLERIPANLYLARATPLANGGFHAIRSGPGLAPAAVSGPDGRAIVYPDSVSAERAALYDLMALIQAGGTEFVAHAEPARRGSGYVAVWGAPGLNPGILRNLPTTEPMLFRTAAEAEEAAMRHLFDVLNKPRLARNRTYKPERYVKLTGPEFAQELRKAGITPSFFAFLYGTSQDRVLKWIDGIDDVPHPARLLLALFQADQGNIDLAETVTNQFTTARKGPDR